MSPVLEQQDWSCVRLVYQITGRGSLQLHLRPHGDNFDYRLWAAAEASDSWLIASVDLPNGSAPYQVGVATSFTWKKLSNQPKYPQVGGAR